MLEKLTELLDSFAEMGVPSYDCLVYHRGKEIYRRMYGFSDYEKTKPINGTERYNIYSCSKPITVATTMTLFERGLFKLDDPLYEYMPEFKDMMVKDNGTIRPAKNPILIRDLFTMSSGLNYDLNSSGIQKARKETDGRCPTRLTMKYIAEQPLEFDPSTRFWYSLSHDVLAALVEVLTGMTFGEYAKKTVFDPLGMKDTTFLIPDEEQVTIAAQYRFNNETKNFDNWGKGIVYKLGSEYESGGAGGISTVNDYIKFAEALRKGDSILKPETIDLIATDMLDDYRRRNFTLYNDGYSYGLGVRCARKDLENAPRDFGWGGAAAAFLAVDREHEFTVYFGEHVLNAPNQPYRIQIPAILREELK